MWMVGLSPSMLWGLLASDQYSTPSDCLKVISVPHRTTLTCHSVSTVTLPFTESDTNWVGDVVIIFTTYMPSEFGTD